ADGADRAADAADHAAAVAAALRTPARLAPRDLRALPRPGAPAAAAPGTHQHAAHEHPDRIARVQRADRAAGAAQWLAAVAADPVHQLPIRVPDAALQHGGGGTRRRHDGGGLDPWQRRGGGSTTALRAGVGAGDRLALSAAASVALPGQRDATLAASFLRPPPCAPSFASST